MDLFPRGFSKSILEGLIDPRNICVMCDLVLNDPMQAECGHRMCQPCVEELRNRSQDDRYLCQACDENERQVVSIKDGIFPDNAMRKEMMKLDVVCPFSDCKQKMKFSKLKDHINACPHKYRKCEKCDSPVSVRNYAKHLTDKCPMRLTKCPECDMDILAKDMETHKKSNCPRFMVRCIHCAELFNENGRSEHNEVKCLASWNRGVCPFGCTCDSANARWTEKKLEEHRRSCLVDHVDQLLAAMHRLTDGSEEPTDIESGVGDQSLGQRVNGNDFGAGVVLAKQASLGAATAVGLDTNRMTGDRSLPVAIVTQSGASAAAKDPAPPRSRGVLLGRSSSPAVVRLLTDFTENLWSRIDAVVTKVPVLEQQVIDSAAQVTKLQMELAAQSLTVSELTRKVSELESTSYDGTMVWRIDKFSQKLQDAVNKLQTSVFSPCFYTGKHGYKLRLRLYPNGDGRAFGNHMSLYLVIMRGRYDALLRWPFKQKVTLMVLDQKFQRHVIDAFEPTAQSRSFSRPSSDMNPGGGNPHFMPLADLQSSPNNSNASDYLKDDILFIKVVVDVADLTH